MAKQCALPKDGICPSDLPRFRGKPCNEQMHLPNTQAFFPISDMRRFYPGITETAVFGASSKPMNVCALCRIAVRKAMQTKNIFI